MKRELNSRSRRKWVVGGALVFGSVALLTTGFATWVVGVTVRDADATIGVGVETLKDNSFILTATVKANDTLRLGDQPGDVDEGFMQTSDETEDVGDYRVDVDLKVTKGEKGDPGVVSAAIKNGTNLIASDLSGVITAITTAGKRTADAEGKFSVVTLTSASFENTGWTETSLGEGAGWQYTKTITLSFANGTLFNSKSKIAEFYNTYYDVHNDPNTQPWTAATIKTAMDAINGELTAASSAINNILTVTLSINE